MTQNEMPRRESTIRTRALDEGWGFAAGRADHPRAPGERSVGLARLRTLEVLGYRTPRTWVPVSNRRCVRRVPLRPGFTAADLRRHTAPICTRALDYRHDVSMFVFEVPRNLEWVDSEFAAFFAGFDEGAARACARGEAEERAFLDGCMSACEML